MYTCAVKMFCKASFISLMGSLKGNIGFKYSYIIFVQLNTLVIHQSIKGIMSDPCMSPSGWACWTPVGNAATELT